MWGEAGSHQSRRLVAVAKKAVRITTALAVAAGQPQSVKQPGMPHLTQAGFESTCEARRIAQGRASHTLTQLAAQLLQLFDIASLVGCLGLMPPFQFLRGHFLLGVGVQEANQ